MVGNIACPKCGSVRTRRVGPLSVDYRRCDACEYLFRERDESQREREPLIERSSAVVCAKCRSRRVRIIGQSTERPPLVHCQCDACGHISSRPFAS
jgi:DNA-directed RNA polymerase subunit M/transcription elongation factor TFIIS